MNGKKIKKLYKANRVPKHIIAHMETVKRIAVFLGKKITNRAQKRIVKINLVGNAALLHDLLKICDFGFSDPLFADPAYDEKTKKIWKNLIRKYGKIGHIKAAVIYLEELKEWQIASIIEKHIHNSLIDPNPKKRPRTLEEKLLYYADKRVLHDRIVNMDYRFDEGRRRYRGTKNTSREEARITTAAKSLEKELCGLAGIKPTDLNKNI